MSFSVRSTKVAYLSNELLGAILTGHLVLVDLPPDTRVVRMADGDTAHGGIKVWLKSSTFAPVAAGRESPPLFLTTAEGPTKLLRQAREALRAAGYHNLVKLIERHLSMVTGSKPVATDPLTAGRTILRDLIELARLPGITVPKLIVRAQNGLADLRHFDTNTNTGPEY